MKIIQVLLLTIFTVYAIATEPTIKATSYKYIEKSLGKGRAHFVEFGSDKCYSCQIMGEKLYKIKKIHPEYNIEFVNVRKERDAIYKFKIQLIPTQIIFDTEGKEAYRHIGILKDDELNNLIKKYKI